MMEKVIHEKDFTNLMNKMLNRDFSQLHERQVEADILSHKDIWDHFIQVLTKKKKNEKVLCFKISQLF